MTRRAKKAGAATIGRPLGFIGTLAIAMAVAMASVLALGPSNAAAQQAVLRAGNGEESIVIPGQVIEIPIVMDMTNAAPLSFGSATFSLGWQTDRLTFVSAASGEFGSVTVNEDDAGSGQLLISAFDGTGTTSTVQILTLSLESNANVNDVYSLVELGLITVGDALGQSILSSVIGQSLMVCMSTHGFRGDVDVNDVVNILDAQRIARYTVGLSPAPGLSLILERGDANGDGVVNILDAQQIARYSVGLPTSEGIGAPLPGGCPPPAAPSNLVAVSNNPGDVDLSWTDNSSDEARFEIAHDDSEVVALNVDADVTTASLTGLDPAVSHNFYVRACAAKCSEWAETTLDPPPPPPASGLLAIEDLQYQGAFQLSSLVVGSSSTNYALGRLAYNPDNHSLFLAGHAVQKSVAEFGIPTPGLGTVVSELPLVDAPIQPFVNILDAGANGNPELIDRIAGMLWLDGQLIINTEQYYDAAGDNFDTSLLVRDANNLAGVVDGYFEMNGRAKAAGYLAAIPAEWQQAFGAEYLTGWSSVNSILSRYSVGPTLWTFDPQEMTSAATGAQGPVVTTPFMNFSYGDGHFLADMQIQQGSASPVWNHLSKGVYGFIVPGTRTFAVFGSSGGVDSGIGYKITQDNGVTCGGYCSYAAADNYSYYWLFDVDDILGATNVYDPQPYAYGRWDVPFGDNPQHVVIGGTFDPVGRTLYVTLSKAGQLGTYDRPPLILSYHIPE